MIIFADTGTGKTYLAERTPGVYDIDHFLIRPPFQSLEIYKIYINFLSFFIFSKNFYFCHFPKADVFLKNLENYINIFPFLIILYKEHNDTFKSISYKNNFKYKKETLKEEYSLFFKELERMPPFFKKHLYFLTEGQTLFTEFEAIKNKYNLINSNKLLFKAFRNFSNLETMCSTCSFIQKGSLKNYLNLKHNYLMPLKEDLLCTTKNYLYEIFNFYLNKR